MVTRVTTGLYEEDLNGNNPANLVSGEIHTLQVPSTEDFYFIIPRAAPFFVASLVVYNHATGVEYLPNVDYTVGHHFIEAMDSIGKPIAGSIRFMRHDINGAVRLKYRTIGGNWGFDDTAILTELSKRQYNPIVRVWGNIAPIPYSFPPLIHDQSLDTLIGSDDLNDSLIRIANALGAASGGTTEFHVTDYENPHRTSKFHVGLGNVDNYATANDLDMDEGTARDLFVTPRGVTTAINLKAVEPLNAHIRDKNNPHETDKEHVGLGKVGNYPVATDAEALSGISRETYMTPYATSLLVGAAQEDPRFQALLDAFNAHVDAVNPHEITAASIGTLTEQEIVALLSDGGGGDAATFGGRTPEQWRTDLTASEDLIAIMAAIDERIYENVDTFMEEVYADEDGGPTQIPPAEFSRKLINEVKVGWDGYSVYSEDGGMLALGTGLQYSPQGMNLRVVCAQDAVYVLDTETGKVVSHGSNPITVSSIANAVDIWATHAGVLWQTETNEFRLRGRDGVEVNVLTAGPSSDTFTVTLYEDAITVPKVMGLITYYDSVGDFKRLAFGDTGWVNAINSVSNISSARYSFAIGDGLVLMSTTIDAKSTLNLYSIDLSGTVSLSEVSSAYKVARSNGNIATISAINALSSNITVNGIYDRFIISEFGKNSFGLIDINQPDEPEWEVPMNPLSHHRHILAGNGYIVSQDVNNYVHFWGDSPDNRLLLPTTNKIVL